LGSGIQKENGGARKEDRKQQKENIISEDIGPWIVDQKPGIAEGMWRQDFSESSEPI
jgi:hypothetical protein